MKNFLIWNCLFSLAFVTLLNGLDKDYANIGYTITTKDNFATLAGGTIHIKAKTNVILEGIDEDGNQTAVTELTAGEITQESFSGSQDYTIKCKTKTGNQIPCYNAVTFADGCPIVQGEEKCTYTNVLKLGR